MNSSTFSCRARGILKSDEKQSLETATFGVKFILFGLLRGNALRIRLLPPQRSCRLAPNILFQISQYPTGKSLALTPVHCYNVITKKGCVPDENMRFVDPRPHG
jgi:hypothetical protein